MPSGGQIRRKSRFQGDKFGVQGDKFGAVSTSSDDGLRGTNSAASRAPQGDVDRMPLDLSVPLCRWYNTSMQKPPQSLSLFTEHELESIQPTGSPWVVSQDDPATVPVPLQTVIVNVDGPYTERDRKLWVFLLHAVFDELEAKAVHSIPVRDINAVFRELGGEHNTKWLWESAKRLAKTTVEWETTFGDGRFEQGISSMFGANLSKKARQMGTLTFNFPPLLIPIIKQPLRFARLRVHFLLSLSGKYAVTLYEILEGFANRRDGRCEVSIDDLRTWLKVPEGSYSAWKDFRKRVLDPAVKQINDDPIGAGFSVEYSPIKQGRFYRSIVFQLSKTDNRQTTERLMKAKSSAKKRAKTDGLIIEAWGEEQARKVLREKGWDYHVVEKEWRAFAAGQVANGNPPKNATAAFVAFCKKKKGLR